MSSLYSHILKELYYESPQSIASLSNRIGKSVPLVTKGIQYLVSKDYIKDYGLAPSNGGRRANLFGLNAINLPYILLVAIDQYKTSLAIFDFANREAKANKKVELSLNKDDNFVNNLTQQIDNYISEIDLNKIAAISITMPGFVNTELGLNTSYVATDDRCQIRNILEKKYNKQTFIENDSTAIAIAEHRFGVAKKTKDLLVVNLNWGVGLGMIINDTLFKGSSGFAGEFSHIPLSNLNKLCSCGKRGCLEVEASLEASISYVTQKIESGDISILNKKFEKNQHIDIYDVLEAAQQGDQLAIESFGSIGYALGKGIATLIHIINPEIIVISGFGCKIGPFLMPQIQSALLEFSIQRLSEKTKIEISTIEKPQLLGTMATAVGHLESKTILLKTNTNKL